MTTSTEDARAALAECDASETQHDAILVVPEVVAALRALIEPPVHASPLSMSPEHGKFGAENLQFEPPTEGDRLDMAILADTIDGLIDDYEPYYNKAGECYHSNMAGAIFALGFRRQASHPEPVTAENVPYAVRLDWHAWQYPRLYPERIVASLEAARAVRPSVPRGE